MVRDIPSGYLLQFAMEAMALIEIDGLPFLKMVIFHGELLNIQVVISNKWILKWRFTVAYFGP